MEKDWKDAENESVKYKNLLEKTEKIVRSVSDEVVPMQKELKDKDKEIKILEKENTDLKFENLEIKKQMKDLEAVENEKLKSEINKLMKSCNLIQLQLKQEMKKSATEAKTLEDRVMTLKKDLEQVNQ